MLTIRGIGTRRGCGRYCPITIDSLDLIANCRCRITIDCREARSALDKVILRDRIRRYCRLTIYYCYGIVLQAVDLRTIQFVVASYILRHAAIRSICSSCVHIAQSTKLFRHICCCIVIRRCSYRIAILARIKCRAVYCADIANRYLQACLGDRRRSFLAYNIIIHAGIHAIYVIKCCRSNKV